MNSFNNADLQGPACLLDLAAQSRQNRQLRKFCPTHQCSGHHPRAWKVRNRLVSVNKEDRKEWAEYRTQNGLALYGYPAKVLAQTPGDDSNRPSRTHSIAR